jgi:hypothetical protein
MAKGTGGFAKTGKAKPAQFGKTAAGSSPKTFKQNTAKTATAAMQGKPPQSKGAEAKTITRKDARKQFGKVPGKAVF